MAAGAVALHPPPQFLLCAEMSNQGSAGAADRQILGGTKSQSVRNNLNGAETGKFNAIKKKGNSWRGVPGN